MMVNSPLKSACFYKKNDANASQPRRLQYRLFSFSNLSGSVRQGYQYVASNSSMGQVRSIGSMGVIGNFRRLRCQIASKQLWPWAFSLLSQLVANKKKLFTLKNQYKLKCQLLSTKKSSGWASVPTPNFTAAAVDPLFSRRSTC